MGTCHHTRVQTERMYNTETELYNVNYELWLITLYQLRFISHNKLATLAGDGDNAGGYACVKTGSIWESSVPSPHFCCEPYKAQSIQK